MSKPYLLFSCIFVAAVTASNNVLSDIEITITNLENEVKQLQQENALMREKLLDDPSERDVASIGFCAIKNSRQNASDGEIVTWDMLLSNLGDSFNLLTSTFLCPVSGYYFFQFNLFNERGSEGQACSGTLVLDGVNQVRAHSRVGGNDVIVLTTSQSAFFLCITGQRVSIQSDFDNNWIGEEGGPEGAGRTSSFSGFLVYEQ